MFGLAIDVSGLARPAEPAEPGPPIEPGIASPTGLLGPEGPVPPGWTGAVEKSISALGYALEKGEVEAGDTTLSV